MVKGRNGKEKTVGEAEYAAASRDALRSYLVRLIRAVVSVFPSIELASDRLSISNDTSARSEADILQVFRPESNRLCRFFELSSLTLSRAPRGGFQGKAGFLKLPGSNASRRANQPGLTPTSWKHAWEPK